MLPRGRPKVARFAAFDHQVRLYRLSLQQQAWPCGSKEAAIKDLAHVLKRVGRVQEGVRVIEQHRDSCATAGLEESPRPTHMT